MIKAKHNPVMYEEIIKFLNLKTGQVIIDATIGLGGHARGILEKISPTGTLIGIDKDNESLMLAKHHLESFKNTVLINDDFKNLDIILKNLNIAKVDGIIFDLGISSYQLETDERGFSFKSDGPLDMRMDKRCFISAFDLVNNLNESELSNILKIYGEEKRHNRIAKYLVYERQKKSIDTTVELAEIVKKAVGYHGYSRLHPATRTFQAIRIAVNRELEALDEVLKKAINLLNPGARICVISFHSLEDRIVKVNFKNLMHSGLVNILTKKPLVPGYSEVVNNPRSRSAKLRVAERL
ncbi:MAG: 16S rRNA (cytosine(1402)-N(4))-methyltransferase RsmH [Candidatus Omnitrophota bacterium]